MYDLSFYKGKKVLVTGHTGFKGSYLTKILLLLGADVVGYALPPTMSLFSDLRLDEMLGEKNIEGDIRDFSSLKNVFDSYKPEIVFHLAAQPIVRTSYEKPLYTYETNVLGTANVLECMRLTDSVRSFLNITTDKVYENHETKDPYREEDRLNGRDPYSNSKSCSELVTASYRQSFFTNRTISISTARAGNVIGGGDENPNRIIPDCIRAARNKEKVVLRNPDSVRPYQFVLEPLFAYLLIAMEQMKDPSISGSYNIGPSLSDTVTTSQIAELFCRIYGEGMDYVCEKNDGPHEAGLLLLDGTKFRKTFSYEPAYTIEDAVRETIRWEKEADKEKITLKEIEDFMKKSGFSF